MPLLDVSEIFMDPDFADGSLVVRKRLLVTDAQGFSTETHAEHPFVGIVTVDHSLIAQRRMSGQVVSGAILIVTPERLTGGQTDRDADIVIYQGLEYRVSQVDPYTAYGTGFVQAHCELQNFDGGIPVEQQQ